MQTFIVAQISDRLHLHAALFVVHATVAAVGYLMLAGLHVSYRNVRYGALFLIHPAVLARVTLSLSNITDNHREQTRGTVSSTCCRRVRFTISKRRGEASVLAVYPVAGYILIFTVYAQKRRKRREWRNRVTPY